MSVADRIDTAVKIRFIKEMIAEGRRTKEIVDQCQRLFSIKRRRTLYLLKQARLELREVTNENPVDVIARHYWWFMDIVKDKEQPAAARVQANAQALKLLNLDQGLKAAGTGEGEAHAPSTYKHEELDPQSKLAIRIGASQLSDDELRAITKLRENAVAAQEEFHQDREFVEERQRQRLESRKEGPYRPPGETTPPPDFRGFSK